MSSLWGRLECLRWTWLVLPTISPAEVHREAFFMESTILLMAPALEFPTTIHTVLFLLAQPGKALLFRGAFLLDVVL